MKKIDFKEVVIIILAERYGKFESKAIEIIKKHNLTEEDVKKILSIFGG